jgi:hypothetical protein
LFFFVLALFLSTPSTRVLTIQHFIHLPAESVVRLLPFSVHLRSLTDHVESPKTHSKFSRLYRSNDLVCPMKTKFTGFFCGMAHGRWIKTESSTTVRSGTPHHPS